MELFLQSCGLVLLAVILMLAMGNGSKDLSLAVSIGVCVLVMTAAMTYIRPVLQFVDTLTQMGGLNRSLVQILMKSSGICIIGELASLVCADAGNSSMAKIIQLLSTAVILWLSLPLFSMLLDLLQKMMGEL